MRLVIAHLSDLHVSRYGEHVTSLSPGRLLAPRAKNDGEWERVLAAGDWSIERRTARRWRNKALERSTELRLLDEAGYVQQRRKGPRADEARMIEELALVAEDRHRTEHSRLARRLPAFDEVEQQLAEDPTNTNLRFLHAAQLVLADEPDWVLVTGDVTDDGIGYDLVLAALSPLVERGRLLAVPGNHDLYDSPRFVVPAHERKVLRTKRMLWAGFAERLGLPAEGVWRRDLAPGVAVVGLDSCHPPMTPISASGEVPDEALREAAATLATGAPSALRVAMVHHHVVNAPIRAVNRSPWQLGMQLRNASAVFDFMRNQRFQLVLNGHRHLGYRFHPPSAPLYVSSPSTTLGDRAGVEPFYWRIVLEDGVVQRVDERPLRMLRLSAESAADLIAGGEHVPPPGM